VIDSPVHIGRGTFRPVRDDAQTAAIPRMSCAKWSDLSMEESFFHSSRMDEWQNQSCIRGKKNKRSGLEFYSGICSITHRFYSWSETIVTLRIVRFSAKHSIQNARIDDGIEIL
jgi:hypothetical protein